MLYKTGHKQSVLAKVIGVHKSTISRKLKRNCGGRAYPNKQAHVLALDKRKGKVPPIIDDSTWAFIEILIRKDWSPEKIHGWMKSNMEMTISHEWIY